MKKSEAGFALIIVLIFISILSELLITMMHSALLASKTIQNISIYSNYIYKTDLALTEAKQSILNKNLECFNQWCTLQEGFLKDSGKLTYKINLLQTVPCFQIAAAEKTGTDFFKISIKLINKLDTINIESTVATPAQEITHCTEKIKTIEPRSSSWRIV